ncbi:hypothetical protein [Glutamicibacter ardleyensis]|uniref:hypothetical protein n=1 Tax=Glutamicibacter ardleyensis TaxID=225894 RepID=UPI003FD63999
MAAEETIPHGLKKYSAGTDPIPGRAGHNLMIDRINQIPGLGIGPLSSRPAPSAGLRFWVEESTRRLSVNTGTEWAGIAEIGGVAPANVSVGGNPVEGLSARSARADHSHVLPLASSIESGAMSAADKQKLDRSAITLIPNSLVLRDDANQFNVGTPTTQYHPTPKGYVDGKKWDGSDITTGVISPDRMQLVSQVAKGLMSPADKTKLDTATYIATGNMLVLRSSLGDSFFRFALLTDAPTASNHATRKDYVDAEVSKKANVIHTHSASETTAGVFDPARLPAATPTVQGALSAADKAMLEAASGGNIGNALARRFSDGSISFFTATISKTVEDYHAARKDYVDSKTWAGSAITSGTIDPARIQNATAAADGLLPKADKETIDGATASLTPNTLARRDSNGNIRFGVVYSDMAQSGSVSSLTRKDYVDGVAAVKANKAHTHDGNEITTGTISPARIANATTSVDGLMPKSDKALLDTATANSTPNALAQRDSSGRINVGTPTAAAHAATKSYADTASSNASNLTNGTVNPARIANASSTVDGLLSSADKSKLDASSVNNVGNTLAQRDSNGGVRFSTVFSDTAQSMSSSALTRKDYVDGLVGTIAPGGWIDLNLRTGWAPSATYGIPQARLVGDKVELRGVANMTTGAPGDIIFSFPPGLIPNDNRLLVVSVMPNAVSVATIIKTSGTFAVTADATITRVSLDGLYFHI